MNGLTFSLRKVAKMLIRTATKPEDLPGIFNAVSDFLKNESDKSFGYYKIEDISVPLSITDKDALSRFVSALKKYPNVIEQGKTQTSPEPINILITLGQMFSAVILGLELYSEKHKEIKPVIQKFYRIWGSSNLNATTLACQYSGKKISDTKKKLIKELDDTSKIFTEQILPVTQQAC